MVHSEHWKWTDPDTLKFVAMSWDAAENWNAPVMPNNRDIKAASRWLRGASWTTQACNRIVRFKPRTRTQGILPP